MLGPPISGLIREIIEARQSGLRPEAGLIRFFLMKESPV
jgi:hypothetical protein